MAYEYRNRRGEVYLLQAGTTPTGKLRYYFGRKLTGEPVDQAPQGYEVYESPERGQVYLRKERLTRIAPLEHDIVVEAIRRLSTVEHFLVDVESDCLVVYLPTRSVDDASRLVRKLAGPDALQMRRFQEARDQLVRETDYEKVMRFALMDEERRLFQVDRWRTLGSTDGWIRLAAPAAALDLIVEQYAEHLSQESFHELF